jgi:PIN domain
MNARKGLVLDANILIRAVFGQRVRQILEAYEDVAGFYSPDVCFQDARKYIPDLSERHGFDSAVGLSVLDQIGRIIEPVDRFSAGTRRPFSFAPRGRPEHYAGGSAHLRDL